ncbi:hypothetical protein VTJ49DRAFT_6093 [Mycothermus thermophilus]|uniref:Uncharacterized protein n=1 Tax=Humicola insolens TaxID=85995 RepID=A0ABR3V2D9_HUMIN
MATTVAHAQAIPPGLHPLQAAALRSAQQQQQQHNQQQPQQPHHDVDDQPFDLTSRKLTVHDFVREPLPASVSFVHPTVP